MGKKRGTVALRLEPGDGGGMLASVIYRGPGGRRRLVDPTWVPSRAPDSHEHINRVVAAGLAKVRAPYADKGASNGDG